jgi:hypothetical protein
MLLILEKIGDEIRFCKVRMALHGVQKSEIMVNDTMVVAPCFIINDMHKGNTILEYTEVVPPPDFKIARTDYLYDRKGKEYIPLRLEG